MMSFICACLFVLPNFGRLWFSTDILMINLVERLSRYLEDQYLEYMILKKNIFWINILGGGIDSEGGDLVDQLDVPSRPVSWPKNH